MLNPLSLLGFNAETLSEVSSFVEKLPIEFVNFKSGFQTALVHFDGKLTEIANRQVRIEAKLDALLSGNGALPDRLPELVSSNTELTK